MNPSSRPTHTGILRCGQCESHVYPENYALPVSPVPHLVGRNAAATDSEAEIIRAALRQMNVDLSHFDDEINQVQSLLQRLLGTKASIEVRIRQHEPLISPLRQLPPEILSQIFLTSIPRKEDLPNFKKVCEYRRAVLLPGSICAWWRKTAMSTPRLWSHIEVCFTEDENERPGEVGLFETWLSRSGTCPLSVYLQSPRLQTEPHPMLAICRSIASRSDRIESANLHLSQCFLDALRAIQGNLPILERLQLEDKTARPEPEDSILSRPPIVLFDTAPSLRRLDINFQTPDLFGMPSWQAISVPWKQLTSLSLSVESSCNDYYSVFSQTPNLVDCQLYTKGPSAPLPSQSIRLFYLRSIECYSGGDISDLLDCLELPELISFAFISWSDAAVWPHRSVISLMSRSSCSLQTLDVTLNEPSSPFSEDQLITILQHTSSLRHLRLAGLAAVSLGQETLRRLRRQPHAQELVPKLEHFALDFKPFAPDLLVYDREDFVDMIKSRLKSSIVLVRSDGQEENSGALLKRLVVEKSHFSAATMAHLQELEQRGLRLDI